MVPVFLISQGRFEETAVPGHTPNYMPSPTALYLRFMRLDTPCINRPTPVADLEILKVGETMYQRRRHLSQMHAGLYADKLFKGAPSC